MKNKFIKMFTLCSVLAIALMCSVNVTYASAEEGTDESGEATTISNEIYGNNLFSDISYGLVVSNSKRILSSYSVESTKLGFTNFIKAENNNDLLISVKFQLDNTLIDMENEVTMLGYSDSTSEWPFYDNFNESSPIPLVGTNEVKFEYYELDASGKILICNVLIPQESLSRNNYPYYLFHPALRYYDYSGELVKIDESNVLDMYISYVEPGKIASNEQLKSIDFDYTRKNSNIYFSSDVIDITSNCLEINVDENTSIHDVVEYISATNNKGDKIDIEFGAMHGFQTHQQGNTYTYILKAEDSNGDYEFLVLNMNIADKVKPTIIGTSEYTVPSNALLSVTAIKNTLILTDNNDSSDMISLVTKYDYYSDNYSIPGVYYVCYTATDTSGNSTDFIVKINVVDRKAPVFYDSNNLPIDSDKQTIVHKSLDSVLLLSDFINTLTARDEVDGKLKIEVHEDKYTGNGNVEGEYYVTLKAVDKSGNVAYHTIRVIVSDNMPSKTILIDKLIIVEKDVLLTVNDFNQIRKNLGIADTSTTYTTFYDEIYESSYSIPGEYLVEYKIVGTSGYEVDGVLQVRVIESRSSGAIVDETENDGIIISILKWIWNLFVKLFDWFCGLFK